MEVGIAQATTVAVMPETVVVENEILENCL
jgi:hypothetical protein